MHRQINQFCLHRQIECLLVQLHRYPWSFLLFMLVTTTNSLSLSLPLGNPKIHIPLSSLLRKAPVYGKIFNVIDLIRQSAADVRLKDKDGFLPLHIACMNKCNADIIQTLLEIYPESAFEFDTKNFNLPIYYLFDGKKGVDENCLRLLLQTNPSIMVRVQDKDGRVPLHHAVGSSGYVQSEEIINQLIEVFPDGASIVDKDGKLPIVYALEKQASKNIINALSKAFPPGAYTLLSMEIANKDWNAVKDIIQQYSIAVSRPSWRDKILPLGLAVNKKAPIDVLISIIEADPSCLVAGKEAISSFDFMNYFRESIEYDSSGITTARLLSAALPVNITTGVEYDHHSNYWWTYILSQTQDRYVDIVNKVLLTCATQVQALANTHDELGRRAVDIATPMCRQLILSRLNFYGRYELRPGNAVHKSSTYMVRLAIDHKEKQEVALKFMKNKKHFDREIFSRRKLQYGFSDMKSPSALTKSNFISTDYSSTIQSAALLSSNDSFHQTLTNDTTLLLKNDPQIFQNVYKDNVFLINSNENMGDDQYVLPVLRVHNSEDDESFSQELRLKGFGSYPYCLVMPAAGRSLTDIITHENIAGRDWKQIRLIMEQVMECLDKIHSKGFIHGDLKPLNIVRDGARMKLIYLDASVSFENENDYIGSKYSTSYASPCFVKHLMQYGMNNSNDNILLDSVYLPENNRFKASPCYDMWSIGVVFFELCTGERLFISDDQGNIDQDDITSLINWSNEFKQKKLLKVKDPYARHLISQLLQKDPTKRPLSKRILAHPFLTGKKAQRLIGEKADYDVFICYRVASDSEHAERLYNLLTNKGLKVWWDKVSLLPGVPWDEGFCDGIMKSKAFVPIFSRDAIANFEHLHENSPCDNVLFELRLALELRTAGFLDKIFPVMIGDRELYMLDDVANKNEEIDWDLNANDDNGDDQNDLFYIYSNYLDSECYPKNLPNCTVHKVEMKLREYCEKSSLGAPFANEKTVASILSEIMSNQGGFVQGLLLAEMPLIQTPKVAMKVTSSSTSSKSRKDKDAFTNVVNNILKMVSINDVNHEIIEEVRKSSYLKATSKNNNSTTVNNSIHNNNVLNHSVMVDNIDNTHDSTDLNFRIEEMIRREIDWNNQHTEGSVDDKIQIVQDHITYLQELLADLIERKTRRLVA